jgi:hypothetical protein
MIIKCKTCKKEVQISPSREGRKKYCSRKCEKIDKTATIKCLNCDKEVKLGRVDANSRKTCSRKCYGEARTKGLINSRPVLPKYKGQESNCYRCKKAFIRQWASQNKCNTCRQLLQKQWYDKNGKNYARTRYHQERFEMLDYYSQGKLECNCCKENNYKFLTIDHINNNGAEHRKILKQNSTARLWQWSKKNNFPENEFQVLCWNCNGGRAMNKGICPHKEL